MAEPSGDTRGQILGPLSVLGLGALAVACCIGLPLLFAALGGLALAAIVGSAAGLAGAALLVAGIVVTRRHRRTQELPSEPTAGR